MLLAANIKKIKYLNTGRILMKNKTLQILLSISILFSVAINIPALAFDNNDIESFSEKSDTGSISDNGSIETEELTSDEIKELSQKSIVLNLNTLNYYNPISCELKENGEYEIKLFDKLFDYGKVKLLIVPKDEKTIIFDNIVAKDSAVKLKLDADKGYIYNIVVTDDNNKSTTHLGTISKTAYNNYNKEDKTSDGSLICQLDIINDRFSVMGAQVDESEPNNSFSTADTINSDDDVYGSISPSGDIDYFKIKFSSDGKANFWLGQIPSGCDYDLYVYDNNYNQLWSSMAGGNSQELISKKTVQDNKWYYVAVKPYSGYSSSEYWLRVKLFENPSDVTESSRVTACFGNDCTNYSGYHRGIDFGAVSAGVAGDDVYSMLSGEVIDSWWDVDSGNVVSIRHLQNPALVDSADSYLNTRYLHLDSRSVFINDEVSNGQEIGTMGDTGNSSEGVHLHFETGSHNNANSARWEDTLIDPIDNFFPDLVCAHELSEGVFESNTETETSRNIGIFVNSSIYLDIEYIKSMTAEEISRFGITSGDLSKFKEMLESESQLSSYYEDVDRLIDELKAIE